MAYAPVAKTLEAAIQEWLNTFEYQITEPRWVSESSTRHALKHLYITYRQSRREVERCKREADEVKQRLADTEANSVYHSQVMTDCVNAIYRLVGE